MLGSPARDGFHTVTPYLMVVDAGAYVAFLEAAFAAEVTYRTTGGAGGQHVELQLGDSRVMVGGGGPVEQDHPAALFQYVGDVDAVHDRAVRAGATSMMPPADREFEEQRGAAVVDPVGTRWFLAHHGPASTSPG